MYKINKKGMTLIEMMVVIAIIAILVSIIMPTVGKASLKSRAAANAANLRSVEGQLSSLRVSNYNAFMTAAEFLNNVGLGSASEAVKDRLNGWVDGLGDALGSALSTFEATDGTLTLPLAPDIVVTAPLAKEVKAAGENGELYLTKNTPMQIYILENQIVCMYGGYTKEDFSDVAEDGVYDGAGIQLSDGEKLLGAAECLLKYQSHDFGDGDRASCSRCGAPNPDKCSHVDNTAAGGFIQSPNGRCDKCGEPMSSSGDSGDGESTPTTKDCGCTSYSWIDGTTCKACKHAVHLFGACTVQVPNT